MEEKFQKLLESMGDNIHPEDTGMIRRAYELADRAHQGQKRESGEPYIIHPLAVSQTLAELGMDADCIAAALLHDVVEDTEIILEDVKKQFGPDVALMVDGVTKIGKLPFSTTEEQNAENICKMLLAMSKDVRVFKIKLADRFHNRRTIRFKPEQTRRDTALETMEVYAPIAHRLGIRAVKEELEDLSLRELDPVAWEEIERMLDVRKEGREKFLNDIKERISDKVTEIKDDPYVEGRVKSHYGIYRKMYMQTRNFEEIYDVYAIRVIVDTVIECYNVLGIIHDMFTPIPNRFKDYISTPKPNMYQSLHTTVIGKEGVPFEVQIRTWDMHYTAEYGVAAHWKYKAGITGKDRLEDRLAWVRRLLEAQNDAEDAEDLLRNIKSDLTPDEVFVFTPKGSVISLPSGSTVIDFAYAIHSAVGNRMVGAKVDGKIVPFDYQVKTGQIIEILTTNAQGHGPNRNWLNFVKTSEAKNKIRSWFKKERREENIEEGRAEVEREFKRNNIILPEEEMQEFLLSVAKRQKCETIDEFLAAIGYGGIVLSRIILRIKDDYSKMMKSDEPQLIEMIPPRPENKSSGGVYVEGLENCLVKFANCCNPLPGDDIVGFITRGYGVSIHKSDCTNVLSAQSEEEQKERFVRVSWEKQMTELFKSTIEIVSMDRPGVLADISILLSNAKVPIHELNAKQMKDRRTNVMVTISISNLDHLKNIMGKLAKIESVLSVERVNR